MGVSGLFGELLCWGAWGLSDKPPWFGDLRMDDAQYEWSGVLSGVPGDPTGKLWLFYSCKLEKRKDWGYAGLGNRRWWFPDQTHECQWVASAH